MRSQQLSSRRTFHLSMSPLNASPCPETNIKYDPARAKAESYEVYEGDGLRAEFPRAQGDRVQFFSRRFETALAEEWRRNGIALAQKPLFQMIAAECWPAKLNIESRWQLPGESPYLPIPMLLLPRDAPMSETTSGVQLPPHTVFGVVHELTDFALATNTKGTVLCDSRKFIFIRKNYGTRWFREGVATQIALAVCARLDLPAPFSREGAEKSLTKIGAAILDWKQTQDTGEQTGDYYAAAFALTSRITESASGGHLSAIITEMEKYDWVDGQRLAEAIHIATGKRPEKFLPR